MPESSSSDSIRRRERTRAPRSSGPTGAYGFALEGLTAPGLLVHVPEDYPRLEIARAARAEPAPVDVVGPDRAELPLADGVVRLDRASGRVTYAVGRGLTDEALVHPYLASAAAIAAYWLGRPSFHAGAFLAGAGAWAVVGDAGSGKSSTLAALAAAGRPVLSDDVLVIAENRAFAGPRSIDLRADAAERLGGAVELGRVGSRDRWRVRLPAVPPEARLCGWITVGWGDAPAVRPLSAGETLERIAAAQAVRLAPREPSTLLDLASLPGFELLRPRSLDALEETVQVVLAAVG